MSRDPRRHVELSPAGYSVPDPPRRAPARLHQRGRGRRRRVERILRESSFSVPYSARARTIRPAAQYPQKLPPRPATPHCQEGDLVDATDQALQPQRQSAPLLLREEAAQLALTAVRLDREPARMQADAGRRSLTCAQCRGNTTCSHGRARRDSMLTSRFGDGDGLAVKAPFQGDLERPAEQRHLQARERQHGPEAAQRQECPRCRRGRCRQLKKNSAAPRTLSEQFGQISMRSALRGPPRRW